MAIILNGQDLEQQSDLQKRVTAELREKQMKNQLVNDLDGPKYDADDSEYMKDLKPTTSLAWAWVLIILAALGIIVAIAMIVR